MGMMGGGFGGGVMPEETGPNYERRRMIDRLLAIVAGTTAVAAGGTDESKAKLNELADSLVRLALVLCGFVYYWTRLQVDPTPRGATHLVSFAISFAEMLVDGVLGVIVWLGPVIAHHHYLDIARDWGPSIRRDQTMGAVALWFGGDIIGIPYLVALFVQWFRDENRLARKVDAELDREEVALRREGVDPTAGASPMQSGLWWETDSRLASRPGFGRRDVWPRAIEEDADSNND
jgi:hypothetical protein